MWGCFEQGLSLPQADGQDKESARLGEADNDELEVVFFVRHEGADICEESFKDEFLSWLGFCWQATEVEQRAVSSVSDVDTKIYVFHNKVEYLSEKEVEEHWGEDAALFNSIWNVEGACVVSVAEDLSFHVDMEQPDQCSELAWES